MPKSLLSDDIKAMLDEAAHAELYASNLYRYMANQLQRLGYFGAQKFFLAESASELEHYQLHANYQNDSGAVAPVPAIEAMDEPVKSLRDAIETAYQLARKAPAFRPGMDSAESAGLLFCR